MDDSVEAMRITIEKVHNAARYAQVSIELMPDLIHTLQTTVSPIKLDAALKSLKDRSSNLNDAIIAMSTYHDAYRKLLDLNRRRGDR